jgi:hypothetical protein
MIFDTTVNGIPCQCQVIHYKPEVPAQLLGRPENCYPSEGAEFEFEILDRKGRRAAWLDKYVNDKVAQRMSEEFYYKGQTND